MTREEAIIDLNALMFILDNDQYTDEIEEALNIGISALKQMGKTQPPGENATSDCISRQAEYVDLSERVTATYYDEEHEEWSMKTVTVEDILWEVCENMPPIVIPADKDGET